MSTLFILVVTTIAIIAYLIKRHYQNRFQYWKRLGVPYIEPKFPFGTGQNPIRPKKSFFVSLQDQHNHFKRGNHRFGGLYLGSLPMMLIVDQELVKHIFSTDFAYFMDRGSYYDEKNDPLSAHLFALEGQKWKNLRAKLTPTFTTGKMKMMYNILLVCADQMIEKIDSVSSHGEPLDIKEIVACFTTDVIGSAAFGLDCNSFKEENSEFRRNGRALFVNHPMKLLRVFFINFLPALSKRIGLTIFDREQNDFFMKAITDMVEYREKNDVKRNDFMQILLELKNNDKLLGGITLNELAAQAFVFFVAGFETSSTVMTFCLYELARNFDVQRKVRAEIVDVLGRHGEKLTYDALNEMKYLNQTVEETLRKYPPLPMLFRKCLQDYKIPGSDVVIEKGTRVFISVLGIHNDPEIYPEPEKFDPDRFSEENKAKRHPYTFLSFGEGPRICIGLRFGMMQAKLGIASILKRYEISLNPRTVLPIKISKTAFLMSTEDQIYLDAKKIEQ